MEFPKMALKTPQSLMGGLVNFHTMWSSSFQRHGNSSQLLSGCLVNTGGRTEQYRSRNTQTTWLCRTMLCPQVGGVKPDRWRQVQQRLNASQVFFMKQEPNAERNKISILILAEQRTRKIFSDHLEEMPFSLRLRLIWVTVLSLSSLLSSPSGTAPAPDPPDPEESALSIHHESSQRSWNKASTQPLKISCTANWCGFGADKCPCFAKYRPLTPF